MEGCLIDRLKRRVCSVRVIGRKCRARRLVATDRSAVSVLGGDLATSAARRTRPAYRRTTRPVRQTLRRVLINAAMNWRWWCRRSVLRTASVCVVCAFIVVVVGGAVVRALDGRSTDTGFGSHSLRCRLRPAVAPTAYGTGAHERHVPPPHFYKLLDKLLSKTADKKLTKLYWPSRKRSPNRLIVLLEPKGWRGTTKNEIFRCLPPHYRAGLVPSPHF